ncbi:hypothetical protein PHYC_00526 [Phycisphaerales bacterium]|nr:hypothetical protein PHYC_00526 [Phycisphaerales bacterium]
MDRLKTILVAVDFSLCSSDAFRQAARIAAWNNAALHALHVVNVPAYRPVPHAFIPFDLPTQDTLVHDAYRRWEDFAPGCEGKAAAKFTVAVGSPREEILRAVETVKPDLLVMGTTSVLDRKRGIGTTAAACVRKADTKVLLVREEQTRPFTSVAACIDFSATSRLALEQAIRVAVQDGAALHVMHVYDNPWHGMPRSDIVDANMPDFDAKMKEAVAARLREFCQPLAHEMNALKAHFHGVQHDEHWSGHGDGLIGFIGRQGVDLAVLGVRSSWSARDFLWGSTAERVCRDAGCSILTVRPSPQG